MVWQVEPQKGHARVSLRPWLMDKLTFEYQRRTHLSHCIYEDISHHLAAFFFISLFLWYWVYSCSSLSFAFILRYWFSSFFGQVNLLHYMSDRACTGMRFLYGNASMSVVYIFFLDFRLKVKIITYTSCICFPL